MSSHLQTLGLAIEAELSRDECKALYLGLNINRKLFPRGCSQWPTEWGCGSESGESDQGVTGDHSLVSLQNVLHSLGLCSQQYVSVGSEGPIRFPAGFPTTFGEHSPLEGEDPGRGGLGSMAYKV